MTQQAEQTDRPIKVGVADKSPLIQAALTHLLNENPEIGLSARVPVPSSM